MGGVVERGKDSLLRRGGDEGREEGGEGVRVRGWGDVFLPRSGEGKCVLIVRRMQIRTGECMALE